MIAYNKIKYTSFKFLVFLYFVLMMGQGSSLVARFDPRINPIGVLLYILCIIYLFFSNKYKINKKLALMHAFKLVLFVWFILHLFILDGGFPILPYGFYILHFITGILIIKVYNKNISLYYEKVMVLLSFISLLCWSIEQLGASSFLLNFPILMENSAGNSDYSLILYTIGGAASSQEGYNGLFRNHGCAWEPGLFAVMLCIAIIFNIFRIGSINVKNKNFLILFSALITTFSTTGYVVLIILIAAYYLFTNRISKSKRIVYIVCISCLILYISNLTFISGKIEKAAEFDSFSIEQGSHLKKEELGLTYTVQRFEGIYLDLFNIENNPLFGYGVMREKSFVYKNMSSAIITSNGITKPIAQMGVILGLLVFILAYKSMKSLSLEYKFPVPWLLFVVFIISSVSYGFDSTPIMRALEMFFIYKSINN